MKVTIDQETGRVRVEVSDAKGDRSWDMAPDQVPMHMVAIDRPDHPFASVTKGDQSAMLDAAADAARKDSLESRNR